MTDITKRQAKLAHIIVMTVTVASGLAAYVPADRIDSVRRRVDVAESDAALPAARLTEPSFVSVRAERPLRPRPLSTWIESTGGGAAGRARAPWRPVPEESRGSDRVAGATVRANETGERLAPRRTLVDESRRGLGGRIGRAAVRTLSASDAELAFPRVRIALSHHQAGVRSALRSAGVMQLEELYLRVFKQDKILEVWARGAMQERFVKVREFPVCEVSGRLGPKRREGDWQVPEGFYQVNALNPTSQFHLSMHVSYPNRADRIRSHGERRLGGDIFVHGGCASIGCVAITNQGIEELYTMFLQLPAGRRRSVPIAIYPVRLNDKGIRWLRSSYGSGLPDYPFWMNLKEGFDFFERTHRPPIVRVDPNGRYAFAERPAPPHTGLRLKTTTPITSLTRVAPVSSTSGGAAGKPAAAAADSALGGNGAG